MTTEKNVEIYRCISILPDDYQEMDNKPTMNGATIEGDLTAKDLKLMSSDSDDYQSISKEEAAEKFIPVIDKDGNVHKIAVSDLPTGGGNGNAGEEDTENTPVKPAELLAEPVIFETAEHEGMHQGDSMIGLVAGKTYKVSALVGANATPFEYEAVAVKTDEEGGSITQITTPDDALFNNHLAIWIMDAAGEMNGEPINTNIIMIGGHGEGSDPENGSGYSDEFFANETYSPVIINSIKEVETVVEYASKQSVEAIEKRVESLERANDDNLLGNSIYVTETNIEETEGNHSNKIYLKNDLPMLGLVPDKQYKVIYTYNGVQHESNCLCVGQSFSEDGNSVGCILQGRSDTGELSPYALSFDNTNVMIFDKVAFCIPEGDSHYDENISSIVAIPNYDIGANELSLPFNIDIIMEIKEECASKKSVDELTERVTILEKSNDANLLGGEPITIQGNADGDSFKVVDFSLGMKAGKQYEIKANVDGQDVVVYGKTENPIENVVMLLPVDGGDFVMLVDQSVSLMLFDNCDLVNGEPAPANNKCVLGLQEYDEIAHLVILNSITEVQVEYATKEEVEDFDARVTALENSVKEQDNLLIESVSLPAATPISYANISRVGLPRLEIGKNYKVSYVYDGVASSVEYTCADGVRVGDYLKGCPIIGGATVDTVIYLEDNVFLIIMDSARLDPTSNPAWTLDETSMVIAASGGSEGVSTKELVVDSIVEMPLATFTNDTEYNSDLGGYIVNRNVPVSIGDEYVDGVKVKIDYAIDEDKRSIETYIYGVEDGYPVIAASPAGTMADMQHLVYGTKDNGLLIASYLTINSNGGAGSAFLLITTGTYANPATIPVVKILGMEKADECVTKSYVDNLIAEINDKLEALLNGTEA